MTNPPGPIPEPIPDEVKREYAGLRARGAMTLNEALDFYRKRAKLSYRDLAALATEIGDPDLKLARGTVLHIMAGRGGDPRPPSVEALISILYILRLELEDVGLDPNVHVAVAGGLDRLRKTRCAA